MKKEIVYTFHSVDNCNMCNAPSSAFKKIGRRMNVSNGINPHNKIGISTTVMRCRNCGLIFSNPLPVPYDLGMHYDIPVTDYYPEDFSNSAIEERKYKGEIDFINFFLDSFKEEGRPTVLDIGSGLGHSLLRFKKAGFDIYGLEPSLTFYQKSKQFLGEDFSNIQNVAFERASYMENQFDFIFSFNVLEHVYYPNEMIIQALKWLKPGGLFGLVIPSSKWLTSKIYNLYYKLITSDVVTNISPMHSPFHLYEFNERSFFENAKNNKYEVTKTNIVATSTHLPKIFDPLLFPIMKVTKTGLRLEVIIRKPI